MGMLCSLFQKSRTIKTNYLANPNKLNIKIYSLEYLFCSDDDFEPYPIDEEDDDVTNGVRPPAYLRDCIAGMMTIMIDYSEVLTCALPCIPNPIYPHHIYPSPI